MRKSVWTVFLATLILAACGGGDDEAFKDPAQGQDPNNPGGPVVASVSVVASTPTLPSSGATPVEISAFVRDANNNFVPETTVVFQADSGGLQVTQGTTDDSGVAKATLTTGNDPSNRTITVTATAGGVTGEVQVNVGGSQLSIQGPNSLVLGDKAMYTVALIDSDGAGIANQEITVESARGNGLSASTVTTNSGGNATFELTVNNTGDDTITVSGMGLTSTLTVAVNSDAFVFVTPDANAEIPLSSTTFTPVTIRWTSGGAPQVGQTINFAATRGELDSTTATTNGAGEATVGIRSSNAGAAVITASSGTATSQRVVEFVATTPNSIDVQPSLFTMGPGEQSTITAVVRDPNNNLVKNQTVVFSLQDVTGGQLSTASSVTNSQGRAQTVYTAGSTTSARDGVIVTATVQGAPAVTDSVALTVAQRQVFLSLGTGNEIIEPNSAQYQLDYVVQVTDASGNGVSGVPLSLSVLSVTYMKGVRVRPVPSEPWDVAISAVCPDEDGNRNGVLDLDLNEDANNSGRIEAGNIATVTPRNAVTDDKGFAIISVFYPQEYAYWLVVELEARASVQGTEFVRTSTFALPGSVPDFTGTAPPGPVSPFGTSNTCADTF